MRKHFLILMLLTLLPLAGWAQFAVNNYVPKGNFIYKITQAADVDNPGKVVLYGIRNGYNPVDAEKALNLEGKITISIVDGPSYDFIVDHAEALALRKSYTWTSYNVAPTLVGDFSGMVTATSVVIPKEFLNITADQFYGYTNMKSISFQEGSEVTTIESGAFNTTQISTFDFSNCSKLTAINNGLFVEAAPAINSYVKTITLPEASEALVTIGTAFQRLPNLTAINNLDKSKITTVAVEAFYGDDKLETLAFPNTVQTIEANAFQGSSVKNLTIDVTSMNDAVAGNVYGTAKAKLQNLTLKGVLSKTFKPSAFADCDNLTTVTMTDMTINGGTIGANAFNDCDKLASLTFNAITEGTIGNQAFYSCDALASVTFGNITGAELIDALIDDAAFGECKKLATIQFGNLQHVTIDADAFKLTVAPTATATTLTFGTLTDVDINASAFEGFTKMTSMTFGAADGLNIASKAFAGCTSAATSATLSFNTLKDVVIVGTATTDGAFYNTTKLSSITFGASENLNIQTFAFENTASAIAEATGTLSFGNAKNIEIGASAFKGALKLQSITFGDIEDDAIASVEIGANAFEGATNLKTLNFGNLTEVEIAGNAFLNATSALAGANYATATFGNLEGSTIEDEAFAGATRLNTVTIGDVTDSKIGDDGTNATFPAVKTVSIGAVKSTTNAVSIYAKAFTFADQSGATLSLANNKSLETVAGVNKLIAAGAFDFSAVVNGAASASFVYPVATIGEIKTANTFAAGALKGEAEVNIAKIIFNGNIATGALDAMIVEAGCKVPTVIFNGNIAAGAIMANTFASLPKLVNITFNGEIATAGIATDAFKTLPLLAHITFNGKLAAGAVAAGAFEDLINASEVIYTYNEADIDLTVNPFAKTAFDVDATSATARIIKFAVTNTDLKAKYEAAFTHDTAFDIYLAYFFVPEPDPDFSFLVYPDIVSNAKHTASPRTAWARWELGARKVDGGTLAAGTNLVVKRVQKIDGTHNAKVTIYGGAIKTHSDRIPQR